MKKSLLLLCFVFGMSFLSCKEDVKSEMENLTEIGSDSIIHKVSQEEIDRSNEAGVRQSAMTKIMLTPELTSMARYLVSANLTNMLSTEKGPYTIFAPTNDAFQGLSEAMVKDLSNQSNRNLLAETLKGHIITQQISTADMVQSLRDAGTLSFTNLNGKELKIVKEGDALFVIDQNGRKAAVGKSDILSNNGTVHLIDAVLGVR